MEPKLVIYKNGKPLDNLFSAEDFVFVGEIRKTTLTLRNEGAAEALGIKIVPSEKWVKILNAPQKLKAGESAVFTVEAEVPVNLQYSPKITFTISYNYLLSPR
jgi:hypothetical protein